MWNRLVERLKELFGRGGNTKAKSQPGQTGPALHPSPMQRTGTTQSSVDRFEAFVKLPPSVRNTEIGEAVRNGHVVLLKGKKNEEYLIGTRRVQPVKYS